LIDYETGTSHTITVRATDAAGNSSSQTFTINVTNAAPTATDDSATTGENTALNVGVGAGVLANDTDPNGFNGTAAVSAVEGAGGNVGAAVAGSNGGSFTLNADGSFDFDPGSDFDDLAVGDSRVTSVAYTLTDATATDTATLTVTVDGVNDAPLIGGDTGAGVTEDCTLTAIGVLTISDADTGEAVFTAQSAAASANGYGTVELDAAGNWTYTLDNANATVQSLSAGQTLADSFTAVSADGSTQVVTITITGADDGAGGSTGNGTLPGADTGSDDPGSGEIYDAYPQVPTDDTPLAYPPIEITIDPVQESPDDGGVFVSQPFSNTDVSQQLDGSTDASDAGRRDGHDDHVYREDVRLRELYFSKHTRFKTAENRQVADPQPDFSQIDPGSQASQRLDMQGAYDSFRDQLDQAFGDEKKSLAFRSKMAFFATATLTAGVVTYLLRASSLLSSLLFSLPAWHRFDPIAVFAGKRKKRKDERKSRDADQTQSEVFFDGDVQ
jgi:VCBS repeat-containing protein